MITLKPKEQPKWYQPRKWLCKQLVNLARLVEPRSPEVHAFHLQQMQDLMITGCSMVRIDPMSAQFNLDEKEIMQ